MLLLKMSQYLVNLPGDQSDYAAIRVELKKISVIDNSIKFKI